MRIDKPACAVFAAALLLMFPRSVFAQEIGVKAGVNVAWMAPQEDETPDITPKPGVVAGVWLRTKVTDRVSFQAEGLFSEKGVKFRFGEFARLDARLRYLEIPLLARADFGAPTSTTRVFVVGGAAPAFELINRATAQFEGREVTRDIGEDIKPFDLGLVGGVGMAFRRALVEARYTHGLLGTNEDDNEPEDGMPNRVFSLTVGFRFR